MLQTTSTRRTPSPDARRTIVDFRDILALQSEGAASQAAFTFAEALAERADGAVVGLMFGVIPLATYGAMDGSAAAWMAAQDAAQTEAAALEARLKPRFDMSGARAQLRRVDVLQGEAGRALALHGHFADVLVVGWSSENGTTLEREAFAAGLFESGRPVVVTPTSCKATSAPRRALIAWTPTREASRAVHDALPLLAHADAVQLLVVDQGADVASTGDPGVDIGHHLARHGLSVDVKYTPSGGFDTADAILNEARYFGADLIVMGGYGHSRAREWMFGGVTKDILARSTIPLLMSH